MPLGAKETKKLEVVEACSGIRSLMTLVTLAVVFAYFTHQSEGGTDGENGEGKGGGGWLSQLKRYSFWRSLLIVLSAVPIAILTNAMRVSGTGVLSRYYGTKVADGFFHSFSGWVIYIVAFLLLFAVGWVLDRAGALGHQDRKKGEPGDKSPAPEAMSESEETLAVTETPAAIPSSKEGSVSV
jgi:exosortase/archaeosortase family protein